MARRPSQLWLFGLAALCACNAENCEEEPLCVPYVPSALTGATGGGTPSGLGEAGSTADGGGGMGGEGGTSSGTATGTGSGTATGMGGTGGMGGMAGMEGMGGMGGMPGMPGMPAADSRPPEEAYASQLQQLKDMGFFDEAQNIRALQATFGNVSAAIERLLQ